VRSHDPGVVIYGLEPKATPAPALSTAAVQPPIHFVQIAQLALPAATLLIAGLFLGWLALDVNGKRNQVLGRCGGIFALHDFEVPVETFKKHVRLFDLQWSEYQLWHSCALPDSIYRQWLEQRREQYHERAFVCTDAAGIDRSMS
jgi:hypothetical protein